MQTYNDVTDINLLLKVVPRRAITERTLSQNVLRESENREKMKHQHIDGALFSPHFIAHRCSGFVIMCNKSDLEYIIIYYNKIKIIYYNNMFLYSKG